MPTYAIQAIAKSNALKSLATALSLVVGLLTALPAAQAQLASTQEALSEMSIGSPDAPVTLHEYSSLTCPHCADFHTGVVPDIKKNYVDTGKVRIVFHDFPLDNLAFAAAMIARCAGPKRHFELYDRLFHTQSNWARSDKPRDALVAIARFSGLTSDDVTACLNNNDLAQSIQLSAQNSQDLYDIKSTPTFIMDGKTVVGGLSYDDFSDLLDKSLKAKGAN